MAKQKIFPVNDGNGTVLDKDNGLGVSLGIFN